MRRSEFCVLCRRQELQRRKEYQQEIKEMQRRVKGRPLLLEQVAQVSVKLSPQSHSTGVHVITPIRKPKIYLKRSLESVASAHLTLKKY